MTDRYGTMLGLFLNGVNVTLTYIIIENSVKRHTHTQTHTPWANNFGTCMYANQF